MPPVPAVQLPDHTYRLPDGSVVPGISRTMAAVGLDWEFKGGFADPSKGVRIHQAVQYAIEGDLDESSMDPSEIGYVHAALACLKKHKITVEKVEYGVGSVELGYATQIDVLGLWQGQRTVLNWKTSARSYRYYVVQSALEALLFEPEQVLRLCVHLRSNGTFKLWQYAGAEEMEIARAAALGEGIKVAAYIKSQRPAVEVGA